MSGVQSIERAFAVLRVLALGPTGVTDIADRTELPKSTVSRLLAALEVEGAVAQRELGGEYELGTGLTALAEAANPQGNMASVVRPFLLELTSAIGESAGFTVKYGRDVYWVDNVEHDALVQVQDKTGHYARMHTVPSGLAMLAFMDEDLVDHYLSEPLERMSARTLTDPAQLREILSRIKADGVFWSIEELDEGITAIAAPFRGPTGSVDGGIFVNGPSYRFPQDGDRERVEKLVTEAAHRLSERFAGE
ncbi:MAG: IclR family transcriptional regulator [Ilumatobacteraceae bacterium]